jgi:hypothetical protein
MIDQAKQNDVPGRKQRLLDVARVLGSQLDILDLDGWAIAAARLSTVVDTIDAELESLKSRDAGD